MLTESETNMIYAEVEFNTTNREMRDSLMAKNTPENNRKHQANLKDRRKAQGLVRKEIWIKPEHWDEVKALVAKLNASE